MPTLYSIWLPLVVTVRQSAARLCLPANWTASCGSAPTTEIEISVSSPEYAWIRLHGKAVFENNMAAKEMCIQNPIVKGQYGEAANPIFEVFYLENAHGVIADFSGNPPYEF